MIPRPASELLSIRRRFKSRLLSWSESYRCSLPKLDQSLKRAKVRRDFRSVEALEDLFPLTIDHDLELKLLERTQAPKLFKLVDSNRLIYDNGSPSLTTIDPSMLQTNSSGEIEKTMLERRVS